MDAQEFCNHLKGSADLITVEHYVGGKINCRGKAIIVDRANGIAVMLGDCGGPETGIVAGAIVSFSKHPEAEMPRIHGQPAYVTP